MNSAEFLDHTCSACGYHVATRFMSRTEQPLATLAWPANVNDAENLPRLPLNFVRCVRCGHIYNTDFDYKNVPYSRHPNLMFNKGEAWSEFIQDLQNKILTYLPEGPVIVEIGYGDGSFLHSLSTLCGAGTFIGFDPHGASPVSSRSLDFRNELFVPARHIRDLQPDIIISRHVLEHLMNPLGFLQQLSLACELYGVSTITYFEVPCIDRVLETGRTVDFYYEHSSQFTSMSFREMLRQSTMQEMEIGYGYNGEVIYSFSKINPSGKNEKFLEESGKFLQDSERSLINISKQLDEIYKSGKTLAIWGGTGKSCAFICRYALDRKRFPVVVDSDREKVGTYVPGTGQEIKYRDWLKENPADIIIIPPQWRARDIINEIMANNITCQQVLIEHKGALIDFDKDNHPY